MLGALCQYVAEGFARSKDFPPMNANLGILPQPEGVRPRKKELRAAKVERAHRALESFVARLESEFSAASKG